MNIENVKALALILQQYGLASIEVSDGGSKIRLEAQAAPAPASAAAPPPLPGPGAVAHPAGGEGSTVDFNRLTEVKSPMVGVFYSAPSPDSPPFVAIGARVKRGDVLCIIESMKLLNEIVAETDGEIVDICMRNGEIAEFGQVLFKMY